MESCTRNRLSTNGNEDMSFACKTRLRLITVASNALYIPLNGEQTDTIFFASAGHENLEEIKAIPLTSPRRCWKAHDRLHDTMQDKEDVE